MPKIEAVGSDPLEIGYSGYATDEHDSGLTWIDGKTIYRKVVSMGALPNADVKATAHGITGIDKIVGMEGTCFQTSSGTWRRLPHTGFNTWDINLTVGYDDEWLKDDQDAGFSKVGSWSWGGSSGFNTGFWSAPAGTTATYTLWDFSSMPAGVYDVYATWTIHANRATNTRYLTADFTPVMDVRVSQETISADHYVESQDGSGRPGFFQLLASGNVLSSDGSIRIYMYADANEYVIADAILLKGRIDSGEDSAVMQTTFDGSGHPESYAVIEYTKT